ncbi:hypothetical protein D3C76_1068120 [compost metagenome]
MHGMRAAEQIAADLRNPEIAHLAFLDQLGHRADGLFVRHVGIDACRLIEIDHVDPQPPQRVGSEVLDRLRASVEADDSLCGRHLHAELHTQEGLLAPPANRLADVHFADAAAVEVGRVEEGETGIHRRLDGPHRLSAGLLAGLYEAHAAQPQRRDLRSVATELSAWHFRHGSYSSLNPVERQHDPLDSNRR